MENGHFYEGEFLNNLPNGKGYWQDNEGRKTFGEYY